jgi:pimeloyl-ACP methyl ester carboxylesterase
MWSAAGAAVQWRYLRRLASDPEHELLRDPPADQLLDVVIRELEPDFRVIAYELRGHGRSGRAPLPPFSTAI